MNTAEVFAAGWAWGESAGRDATPREAATAHPEYSASEVDVFRNGSEDGAKGDRWRLDGCPPLTLDEIENPPQLTLEDCR